MSKYKVHKRAYIRLSKLSYAKQILGSTKRVMVGMCAPNGIMSNSFTFEWVELNGENYVMLQAFEDAWSDLWLFNDLLEKMAKIDSNGIQETEFCQLLDSLGIMDVTQNQ